MDVSSLIPIAEAIPVNRWFLHVLLVLTFVLHLLMMNAMLGSAVIALVSGFRRTGPGSGVSLSEDLSHKLPYMIAFTINLGVAPLLFIQVLYGQFIYVSSVLMAVFWLSIVGMLILAYYSAYFYTLRFKALSSGRQFFIFLSVVLLLIIGFLFTGNMTLMVQPARWTAYFDRPGGTVLNLSDPTLWPRYLHFVMASLAIGGLFLAVLGTIRARRGHASGEPMIRTGMNWFTHSTIVQILVGLWFLIVLPRPIMLLFMADSGYATVLFLAGIALVIAALVLGFRKHVTGTLVSTVLLVVVMALMRDVVRSAYLGEYFSLASLEVAPQYSPFYLFLAVFIGGLALVYVMLKWAYEATREVTS